MTPAALELIVRSTMSEEICAINIGPRERAKRVRSGWLMLLISAAVAAALLILQLSRWWSAVLFLPLLMSGLGFFQAREKT